MTVFDMGYFLHMTKGCLTLRSFYLISMRIFFSLSILFFSVSLVAQTGDRDRYIHFRDSLRVYIDGDRLILQHIVAPGQTLFGLARFYGLEKEELVFYNPAYKENLPAIMDTVLIPVPKKAILPYVYPDYARWKAAPVFYTANKGETLFQISRRVFGHPVDSVKKYNPHLDNNIKVGDQIFIGWLSTKGIPDSIRQFTGHPLWTKSHRIRSQYMQLRKSFEEHAHQGYGTRIHHESNVDDIVVLHNESPMNQPIALKNPINNRIVFAKVIGEIPPGTYPPGTAIVVSDQVARMLAVTDDRFFVRIKYLR